MRAHGPPLTVLVCCLALSAGTLSAGARGETSDAPILDGAPNLYGHTGIVRTASARAGGNLVFDFAASGFGAVAGDFLVPGDDDFNAFVGGWLSASGAFLDIVEVSLATRAASNANTARGPSQFSLGDLFPSLKLGYSFLPVAVGLDLRGHLPTRVDRAGYDLDNWALTTQGLVTVDLHTGMKIPLRAHLNGGYVFQGGKYRDGINFFEENPNFYNGIDGQLLALAADAWFYDSITAALGVEVPLPWVTPFLETWYRTAVGVPENRGAQGAPYDAVNNAHLIVTPGARVSLGGGLTLDASVDVGLLGSAGGGTDLTQVVDGTPPNPAWLARLGISGTFDPFRRPGRTTTARDHGDRRPLEEGTTAAEAEKPAPPGRIVGWVTNKEDESIEADLELWDATGVKPAGRSVGGGFDLGAAPGPAAVVAKADGYLASGASTFVEPGGRSRVGMLLKKAPKSRKATLTQEKIATTAKVPFEFKKARLQSTAEYVLDDVVDVLHRNPSVRLRIDVYAEPLPTPEESQRLADERAAAVADYFVARGVWRGRLETRGMPLSPGDSEKLRRVELVVLR
jgi:outer membrane protein OmpA-like peptidoglycan-associated protein